MVRPDNEGVTGYPVLEASNTVPREGPYEIVCKNKRELCLAKMEQNNEMHLGFRSTCAFNNKFYAYKYPQYFLLEHEATGKYLSTAVKYASINTTSGHKMFAENYS